MSHFSHKKAARARPPQPQRNPPKPPEAPQGFLESFLLFVHFLVVCSHVNVTLQSQKGKGKTSRAGTESLWGASGFFWLRTARWHTHDTHTHQGKTSRAATDSLWGASGFFGEFLVFCSLFSCLFTRQCHTSVTKRQRQDQQSGNRIALRRLRVFLTAHCTLTYAWHTHQGKTSRAATDSLWGASGFFWRVFSFLFTF